MLGARSKCRSAVGLDSPIFYSFSVCQLFISIVIWFPPNLDYFFDFLVFNLNNLIPTISNQSIHCLINQFLPIFLRINKYYRVHAISSEKMVFFFFFFLKYHTFIKSLLINYTPQKSLPMISYLPYFAPLKRYFGIA